MIPEHLLAAIQTYIPPLGQWLDLSRAHYMVELILENKPEVCVEIGSFRGQSLITQAFAIRENNFGKIYAIDPWKVEFAVEGSNAPENDEWWAKAIDLNAIHTECMSHVWEHHLDPWVVVIRSASQHVHQLFPQIDHLYIDGCHSEVASCRDVDLYVPQVRAEGIVMMDDADWPTTQEALRSISEYCELTKDFGNLKVYRKRSPGWL